MRENLTVQAKEIPLYLLPEVIARLIRLKGDATYRISIVRTHWHHYNVSIRTKRIKRELAPVPLALFSRVPGNAKRAKKAGRECAA
jgi:hypothetical protein